MFRSDLVLENTAVSLRPMQLHHAGELSKIATGNEIWTYFVLDLSGTGAMRNYVQSSIKLRDAGVRLPFVICVDDEIVGSTAFGAYSDRDQRVEIGWSWVSLKVRGSPVNMNAKFLLMSYAFDQFGMERVEFKTDVLNARARCALEKIGAVEEGVLRSHTAMHGLRRRDTVYYSVLRHEWPARKAEIFRDLSPLRQTVHAGV